MIYKNLQIRYLIAPPVLSEVWDRNSTYLFPKLRITHRMVTDILVSIRYYSKEANNRGWELWLPFLD